MKMEISQKMNIKDMDGSSLLKKLDYLVKKKSKLQEY
jgi:hypothetical protein